MIPDIFYLLSGDVGVAALLGADDACRVFPAGSAPPDVATPYVTWQLIAGSPENLMSDKPGSDRCVIQFDAWGDAHASTKAATLAVRDAVETVGYVVAFNPSDRDNETNRYRYSFDAEFHVMR
jgi:hypothetical protein